MDREMSHASEVWSALHSQRYSTMGSLTIGLVDYPLTAKLASRLLPLMWARPDRCLRVL